jgi:hypothetical protein
MDRNDVDAIRRRSRASSAGPWVTDYNEMAKKTVLRRHFKILPMATEDLSRALAMDHEDVDLTDVATGAAARLADDFGNAKPADATVSDEPQLPILLRDTIEKATKSLDAARVMYVLAMFAMRQPVEGDTVMSYAAQVKIESVTECVQALLATIAERG